MSEWTPFDEACPKTAIPLLVKLNDGRVLKATRFHTELHFDDIASGELKADHWQTQLQAVEWKYNK